MAVTTFENFYNLVKNNIVYFQYYKENMGTLNIKGTLLKEFIPDGDNDIARYDSSLLFSDFHLGSWEGSDSDRIELINRIDQTPLTVPLWLKVYSTNYGKWFNIEIANILSLEVVDS